jgi:hypothetical protein
MAANPTKAINPPRGTSWPAPEAGALVAEAAPSLVEEATKFPPASVRVLAVLEVLETAEEADELAAVDDELSVDVDDSAEVVLLAEVLAEERPDEVLLSEAMFADELAAEEAAEVAVICKNGESAKEGVSDG